MSVIIGKLNKKIFESSGSTYHVFAFRAHGGKKSIATYRGKEAPKALKTIEYVLHGKWVSHDSYGKQFEISHFERSSTHDTEQKNQSHILVGAMKSMGSNDN